MLFERLFRKDPPKTTQTESPHDIQRALVVEFMEGKISRDEFFRKREENPWHIDLRRAGSKLPMGK